MKTTHKCFDCGSLNVMEVDELPDPGQYTGGRAPYGFIVVSGRFQFDPFINGPQLTEIMRAHNTGMSYRALADELNAHRVIAPGGGEWSHSSVRRVITNGKRLAHLIPVDYVLPF